MSLENLQRGLLQDGEIFEVREAPSVLCNNDLYLLVTRLMRPWFRWTCLIYCDFQVSWMIAQLRGRQLHCSMRSDWAKEVVIVLCWWACVVVLLSNNFSPCLLSSRKRSPKYHWSSSYSINLRTKTKHCLKGAMVSPSYFIKTIAVTNIVVFRFRFLMTQLTNSFF